MLRHNVRAVLGKIPAGHEAKQPNTAMVGAGSLVVLHKGELREAITVRTYFNERGSGMQPVRACVWLKPADRGADWRSGRGSAGGCGYHKESQAIADAVASCGVSLFGVPSRYRNPSPEDLKKPLHFGGTGSSGYEEIFSAIARALGYRGRMVWVSHGL